MPDDLTSLPPTPSQTSFGPPPDALPAGDDAAYPCIGVCMADPGSGLCQGCGRPLAEPESPDPDAG